MSKKARGAVRRAQTGNFLVATPFLGDTPYRRSVVLVVRHNDQGSLGFVVNDKLKSSLAELDTFFRSNRTGNDSGERFPGIPLFTAVIRWGAGKLDQELEQGVWMSTPARLDRAFGRDNLWSDLIRQIGRGVLRDGLGIKSFPSDPSLN
jgi:putative transcriptional regulator